MTLYDTLDTDFKTALRAKDEVRLSVLRMLKTAAKNKEVELKRKLDEAELLGVIKSQAKMRRDSIEQFTQGGRADLAEREAAELSVLETYLPQQMGAEELENAIDGLIAELGAGSVKDMGRVMKELMNRFAGRVDGKEAGGIVKSKLSSL